VNKLLSLRDLFQMKIRALWNSESHIAAGLPFLAETCDSRVLQTAVRERVGFAEKRSLLLAGLVPGIEGEPEMPSAVKAILDEGKWLVETLGEGWIETQPQAAEGVMDAAIASIIFRLNHLNIADYGSAHAYASLLRRQDAIIFYQLLRGEMNAERELSRLMEVLINPGASAAGEGFSQSVGASPKVGLLRRPTIGLYDSTALR